MTPDDPRHGTHAGNVAHWKDGERSCPPCAEAARKARKARRLDAHRGNPRTVSLGDAWRVIDQMSRKHLESASGIKGHRLASYHTSGPSRRVHRATRDRILAAERPTWTPIGIQRRLCALSALGWSMSTISGETGINADGLKRLRRRGNLRFVREAVALSIVDVYERLCMTAPDPNSHSARRTIADAKRRRYVPPLAWDDIDRDEWPRGMARPGCTIPSCDNTQRSRALCDKHYRLWASGDLPDYTPPERIEVDPVVVSNLLDGQAVSSTRAEKDEAMRQWKAAGKSEKSLCRIHGWHDGRYGREDVA